MRTVVHRLNGERKLACVVALKKESCHLTHSEYRSETASQVSIVVCVSLLSDSERNHLKRRVLENLYETLPVLKLVVSLERLGDGSDDLLLDGAIRAERNSERKVVVRSVCFVYNFIVKCLCNDDASVILACVESVVEDGSRESTEDVSATEMNPCRIVMSFLLNGSDVELRQFVSFCFPFSGIEFAGRNVC